ncbi:MAG: XRE family transcriptional regulator [Alphaproteobacteria bacterium PA2]|nr:MAG: XRE family transcriptional regulator [Alphaproteobacteria bacterium PA2]
MVIPGHEEPYPAQDRLVDQAVGKRVRDHRRALGLSQRTLAAHLGVAFQQVQKYEGGVNRMSASMLVRAAEMLKTTVSDLVGEFPHESRGAAALARAVGAEGAGELLSLYRRLPAPERNAVRALVHALAGD